METGEINIGEGSGITSSPNFISTGTAFISTGTTSCDTTTSYDTWGVPFLVDVLKGNDYVCLIYKQESSMIYCSGYRETRAIKETDSVVDGKWKVDVVYGKVIPPQDETYEFDESE